MGLNFSHTDAQWSMRGFHEFRTRIAEDIGIDLNAMDMFTTNGKSWDTVTDPIKPLLAHSDCDGELTPLECATVAPRLRELVQAWNDPLKDLTGHGKTNGLKLAEGMEKAAASGQPLKFRG